MALNDNEITTFNNCVFNNNSSTNSSGGWGGAIYSNGGTSAFSVQNSSFYNNNSYQHGGAIAYLSTGLLTLSGDVFLSNRGPYFGGALYAYHTSATITTCNFTSNTGGQGGAIYNDGSSITINGGTGGSNGLGGSVFSQNAAAPGGAIYSTGSTSVYNAVFHLNAQAGSTTAAGSDVQVTGNITESYCVLQNALNTSNYPGLGTGNVTGGNTQAVATPTTPTGCTASNLVSLPIKLTSFTSSLKGGSVVLDWSTAAETNNAGFYVLRSNNDGNAWNSIGFVATQAPGGNSNEVLNYTFTDPSPEPGNNYYRLKQVDLDNQETLSNILVETLETATVKIFPDPAASTLNITGTSIGTTFKIVNTMGQIVIPTTTKKSLDVSSLSSGIYFLQIIFNGKTQTLRFMKK